jgi:hypothetical protein
MLEHCVRHFQHLFNAFLRFSAVALTVIVVLVARSQFLIVDKQLQQVGFTPTLDTITVAAFFKLDSDQHGFAVGFINQVFLANIGESLTIQGVTKGVDYGSLTGSIPATCVIAT